MMMQSAASLSILSAGPQTKKGVGVSDAKLIGDSDT